MTTSHLHNAMREAQIICQRQEARTVVTNSHNHRKSYVKLCWEFLLEHGAKDPEGLVPNSEF